MGCACAPTIQASHTTHAPSHAGGKNLMLDAAGVRWKLAGVDRQLIRDVACAAITHTFSRGVNSR